MPFCAFRAAERNGHNHAEANAMAAALIQKRLVYEIKALHLSERSIIFRKTAQNLVWSFRKR